MAQRKILPSQSDLRNFEGKAVPKGRPSAYPKPDVTAFYITTIDVESKAEIETLALSGTNLPFHPFTHPVSQEIHKYYYPGGENRIPTLQVMGSMDESITLEGKFKSTKIYDVSRRDEPLQISNIMERLTKEGNLCKFQIGDWIRYGYIEKYSPSYLYNAEIDWQVQLTIISEQNPLEEQQQTQDSLAGKVFSSDELDDITDIRDKVLEDVEAAKKAAEESGYLGALDIQPFSISRYLAGLEGLAPIGDVLEVGQEALDFMKDVMSSVDSVLTNLENFTNEVENATTRGLQFILFMEGQRSRLFGLHSRLYNVYSRISSSIDTVTRLSSYNPIANLGGMAFSLQSVYKSIEDRTRSSVRENIRRVHIVKRGETLQSISVKYYGSFDRWQEIKTVNNLRTSTVSENQVLIIPE